MSAPLSLISICSGTRLNNRYVHTAYFKNRAEQFAWFNGKVVKSFQGYTTLRRNWPIKVQATLDETESWDYLFFQNPNGRTYFYFITSIQYVNDNNVELTLEMDVIQTYLTDLQLLPCYVERMHTTDDTFGSNTVDEGLAVDEYVTNTTSYTHQIYDLCIIVQATQNPGLTSSVVTVEALPSMYDHVFSGLTLFAVNSNDWVKWGNKIDELSKIGKESMIVSMWMYPKNLVKLAGESTWDDDELCKPVKSSTPESFHIDGRPDNLNGYTPKNNKLFCYPYAFLYASNNSGGSAVYRYERFRDPDGNVLNELDFKLYGALGADTGVLMAPQHYNGEISNSEEGLSLGNYPTCAWESDIYKMWLAQNQNQHGLASLTGELKVFGGAVAGVAGLATGNVAVAGAGAGALVNGAMQIAELEAQKRDMSITPPQARGAHHTSVNVANARQLFNFARKSVSYEYARKIDDYFTMYGYRLGRCATPRFDHRKSHCYIKTIDCKVGGSLCAEDSAKIESIFDKGVTFWKNPDGLGDYSRDNAIV